MLLQLDNLTKSERMNISKPYDWSLDDHINETEIRNKSETNFHSSDSIEPGYLLLIIIPVWIVLGNMLVIIAIARDRKLRTVTNQMVISLAVSDLIIGITAVPLTIMYKVLKSWPLGRAMCHLFHSCDVFASTASILNLVAISLDRYWAVSHPISYPRIMSKKRACISIAIVWILSATIAFPVIAWWDEVDPIIYNQCYFTELPTYLLLSSAVSFYIPALIMIFVYIKIFMIIRRQSKRYVHRPLALKRTSLGQIMRRYSDVMLRAHRGGSAQEEVQSPYKIPICKRLTPHSLPTTPTSIIEGDISKDVTQTTLLLDTVSSSRDHSTTALNISRPSSMYDSNRGENTSEINGNVYSTLEKIKNGVRIKVSSSSANEARRLPLGNEVKVARTLALVLGLFLLCWLPFFVCNVIFALCRDCIDSEVLFQVVTWLGYINSGLNPVIYALSMKTLRTAFIDILCYFCKKKPENGVKDNFVTDTVRVVAASFRTRS